MLVNLKLRFAHKMMIILIIFILLLSQMSLNNVSADNHVPSPLLQYPAYSTTDSANANLPVPPVRITDNVSTPLTSHQWFTNLYFDPSDWADPEYPNMIGLIADPLAVRIEKTGGGPILTALNIQYVYNAGQGNPHYRIPYELAPALEVNPLSSDAGVAHMDGYSDWGLKMAWNNGDFNAYAYNGSPFVYFESNDGIRIQTKDIGHIWYNQDNVLGVSVEINIEEDPSLGHLGTDDFVIYAPTGSTWEVFTDQFGFITATSDLNGLDYASVVSLPREEDVAAKIDLLNYYKAFAYNFITDTKVSWEYNEEAALVTTTFTSTFDQKEPGSNNLVYALYPHQWLNYNHDIENITYNSARGPMKVIETQGNRFITEMTYYGILPSFPHVADESLSGYSIEELRQHVLDQVAAGEGANIFQRNTIYGTSVTIGRTAHMIDVANDAGLIEERDTIIQWVKNALEDWLSYSGENGDAFFYYNADYGSLIGVPPESGMFSDSHLNDHHFEYGYMIKAAAIVASYDKQWALDWEDRINLLIREVDNWDRTDTQFPFLRFMNPYQGHSWATGAADFRDGANQESSSEAMNFASGVAQWGMVMGNDTIRDLGIYLYTTEGEAVLNYWFDINDIVFPNGPDFGDQIDAIWEPAQFNYPMVGWIWGDKAGFATWFGSEQTGYQEYPVGINLLPMTAGSLYLARDTEYITNFTDWFLNKYGQVNRWNELFWEYLALADPERALTMYNTSPHGASEPSPPSETEPHYYSWIHNMVALGAYDSSITANTPSYAVFNKNGERTYVAYNPTNTDLVVQFSDGSVVTVPPGELIAEKDPDQLLADAGENIVVLDDNEDGSESVMLDGSGSFNSNGTITSYEWLENGMQIATGVSPTVVLDNGEHLITLTVTGSDGTTASDEVLVWVTAGEPIAIAGSDQSLVDLDGNGSETVVLDGSRSFAPVGTIAEYRWTEDGTQIAIGVSPNVDLSTGNHNITLTVTSDIGKSSSSNVLISIDAEIGQNATVTASSTSEGIPGNINDGNENSVWVSEDSDAPQWIVMDFGGMSDVSQVNVTWGDNYYATTYEVQISDDESFTNFEVLGSINDGDGGEDVLHPENHINGSYVRLYATEGNGGTKGFEDSSRNFIAEVTSSTTTVPTITFVPLVNDIGIGFCYIQPSVNGSELGSYPCTPNQPYELNNVIDGDIVSFNYKYTLPTGAQADSDIFEFTVGNVNGGKVYSIKEIKVFSNSDVDPVPKYELDVLNGTGEGNYREGELVLITGTPPLVQPNEIATFEGWTGDVSYLDDPTLESTTVTMPNMNITVTANYLVEQVELYDLMVENGSGSGSYKEGDRVIVLGTPPTVEPNEIATFEGWTGDVSYLENPTLENTAVTMPNMNISVTANYSIEQAPVYQLMVQNGTGSGNYQEGELVKITGTPPQAEPGSIITFTGWTGDISYLDDAMMESTVISIPNMNISVTANYSITPPSEGEFIQGVEVMGNQLTIWFKPNQFSPGFVLVHHVVYPQPGYEENYFLEYNSTTDRYERIVTGTSIDYSFTYTDESNTQITTDTYHFIVE
ncbi:glycosyl hydrolase [Chengkuizengella marina]|nr:glycosyl hydrolase [Chengkuizengella marina]